MTIAAKGRPLDPRRVLKTLRESPKLVWGAVASGALMAFLVWCLLPNSYESHAVLLYEGQSDAEEVDLRELRTIASSVELTSSLWEVQQRLSFNGGPDEMRPRIDAVLEEDSNLLRIHGRAPDAEAARHFVTAVLDVFLARQSKLALNRNQERIAELKVDLAKAKTALTGKHAELRSFLDGEGIGDLDAEQAQALEQVQRLTAASENEGAVLGAEQGRLTRLKEMANELPGSKSTSSQSASSVRRRLRKAQSELAEARSSLSNEHPRVQSLLVTVKGLKKELAHSSEGLSGSEVRASQKSQSNVAASRGKRQAFQELAAAAEERLKKINRIQGRVSELRGAIEVAQTHVTELQGDLATQVDESNSINSGFRVMVPPRSPDSSLHAKRNVFLALGLFVLGFLVSILVALYRRLGGLKVFTAPEVAWWGAGPVLGMTTWPTEAGALDALVAELEDYGSKASGKTLVIPASESERGLAASFASELSDAPWLAAGILDVTPSSDNLPAAQRPKKEALITPPPKPEPTKPKPLKKLRSEKATMIGVSAVPDPIENQAPEDQALKDGLKAPRLPTVEPDDTSAERRFENFLSKTLSLNPKKRNSSTPPKKSSKPSKKSSSKPPRNESMGKTLMMGSEPPPSTSKYPRPPSKPPKSQAEAAFKPTISSRPPASGSSPSVGGKVKQVAAVSRATVRMAYSEGNTGTVVIEDGAVESPKYDSPAQSKREKVSRQVMRAAIRVLRDSQDETPAFGVKVPTPEPNTSIALAWNGPLSGPVFRRAVRLSDRVVVLVQSGERTGQELRALRARVGRETGVGFLVVGSSPAFSDSTDRVGNVAAFWGDGSAQ